MLYEFIVLALLAQRTAHGYWIAKVINDAIGPYARISNGRLYPLLSRLERDGLIEAAAGAEAGGRRTKAYALTPLGASRLHGLMLDTTTSPGDYQRIFQLKAAVMDLVDAPERLRLIDHYLHYCRTNLEHIAGEIEELERVHGGPIESDRMMAVMRHRLRQWELELSWAGELRRAEVSTQSGDRSS